LRRLLNSHMMTISVTSLPAQPILELQWELLFISIYHCCPKTKKNSKQLLTNTTFKLEVLMESILKLMTVSLISQIEEDSEDQWPFLSKTCMMVLKKWSLKKRNW
jgi:hypothetical protein